MNITERLGQLDERERRLLGLLVIIFLLFVLLLIPVGVAALLGSKRGEVEALQEAIDSIVQHDRLIAVRSAERAEIDRRYATPAPPLAGFLATQAEANQIEIPESQDQPVVPHGKRYEERSTKIVLRKTGMLGLLKFMEKIEQSRYPMSISRLNIRKRSVEPDSYDVQMVVSAYDRKAKPKASEAGGGSESEKTPEQASSEAAE